MEARAIEVGDIVYWRPVKRRAYDRKRGPGKVVEVLEDGKLRVEYHTTLGQARTQRQQFSSSGRTWANGKRNRVVISRSQVLEETEDRLSGS